MNNNSQPLFDVAQFVTKYGKPLSSINFAGDGQAIFCFSSSLAKKLSLKYQAKRVRSLGACFDIYTDFKKVVVSQFGFGAPATILQMEYLRVLGFKNFYSVGMVCALSSQLKIGQTVFIKKAYQRKNTSEKFVTNPHQAQASGLLKNLEALPVASLSSDFPFQESQQDYQHYLSQSISCLEMEAYNLMNRAQDCGLKIFCFANVSDFVTSTSWQTHFGDKHLHKKSFTTLEQLLES